MALGPIFLTSVTLETGLKFDDFVILGSPQILSTRLVGGKLVAGGSLVTNNPGSLKPDSRDPETETGNLETEKRIHRMHDTLETGLRKDASQPGGPHKGGRRIHTCV